MFQSSPHRLWVIPSTLGQPATSSNGYAINLSSRKDSMTSLIKGRGQVRHSVGPVQLRVGQLYMESCYHLRVPLARFPQSLHLIVNWRSPEVGQLIFFLDVSLTFQDPSRWFQQSQSTPHPLKYCFK